MNLFLSSLLGGRYSTRVSCDDGRRATLCGRASLPASRNLMERLASTLALPCFESAPALNIEHPTSNIQHPKRCVRTTAKNSMLDVRC